MASVATPTAEERVAVLNSLMGGETMRPSSSSSGFVRSEDKDEENSVSSSLASDSDDLNIDSSVGDVSIDDDSDDNADGPRTSRRKDSKKTKGKPRKKKPTRAHSDDIPRQRHTSAPAPQRLSSSRRASNRKQHKTGTEEVDESDEGDFGQKPPRRVSSMKNSSHLMQSQSNQQARQQRHQRQSIRRTKSAIPSRNSYSADMERGSSHHSRTSLRNRRSGKESLDDEETPSSRGAKHRQQIVKNPGRKSVLQIQLAQAVERQEKKQEEMPSDSESSSEEYECPKRNGKKDYGTILAKAGFSKEIDALPKSTNKGSKKKSTPTDGNEDDIIEDTDIPEHLDILIEILSARNLLIADTTTSDPYVLVKLGDKDIHKTSKILKTLNPDWTPDLRSTFLLSCKANELFECGGLLFKLNDWDFMVAQGKHDPLGTVLVDPMTLIKGKGAPTQFTITPPPEEGDVDAGTLTIRCRKGTVADYDSLKKNENKNLFLAEMDSSIPKHLSIMVEIVCARNLLIADTTTSDPYVLVKMGDKEIHKTSKVLKTLNPDWTTELRSTFVIEFDSQDLFGCGGLLFKLNDWDFMVPQGRHDPLGTVFLDAKTLCTEERALPQEYKIVPPKGQENEDAGTLTIHYRRANEADYELCKACSDIIWNKV